MQSRFSPAKESKHKNFIRFHNSRSSSAKHLTIPHEHLQLAVNARKKIKISRATSSCCSSVDLFRQFKERNVCFDFSWGKASFPASRLLCSSQCVMKSLFKVISKPHAVILPTLKDSRSNRKFFYKSNQRTADFLWLE